MRVVVIGNYLSQNLGDDMYLFLLQERYPLHEFIPHSLLGDRRPDFIIFGGGGILRVEDPRVALLHRWRKKFRINYGVLSVGSTRAGRLKYSRNPFPGAKFVTVRDHVAYKALEHSELIPDLAWAFEPESIAHLGEDLQMGIMLRHSHTFNAFDLASRARAEMARFDESWYRFFSTYGERLGDRTLANVTRAGFPSIYVQYTGEKPDKYLENYRHVKRVVAMPLHGIIFAAIFSVPWASWAYSHKTEWLAEELGAEILTDLCSRLVFNKTDPVIVERLRREANRHFKILDRHLA